MSLIRSQKRRSFNVPRNVPLGVVLTVPFVVQILLVLGIAGYLSFRNGQQAVNNVAYRLRGEISARIEEHLRTFLQTPHRINQINADILQDGWIAADDQATLEHYFWEQVQSFDSVTSIYFGNTRGGLVNAGREGAAGSLYVIETDGFAAGPFRKYATDSEGNHAELLASVPDFDARARPWYTDAVARGGAGWSDIYILFSGQDMAVAASRPVYDAGQNLLGVVSSDIFLSHLSNFMQGLEIGETGHAFIVERSGLLIASSTGEQLFTRTGDTAPPRRLHASESAVPLVGQTASFLAEHFGDYGYITQAQHLEFEIEGQRQFLYVAPIEAPYGIDWLVVVAIPESDFLGQISANNRSTALLVSAAFLTAVALGIITAHWIARPILQLRSSAQLVAQGSWPTAVTAGGWIGEIGELSRAFGAMTEQLRELLHNLTREIGERRRAEESLRQLKEFNESIIQNMTESIVVTDAQGQITFANPAMSAALGYTVEALIGQSWLMFVPPDQQTVARAADERRAAGQTDRYELTLQRKDGTLLSMLVSGSPRHDGQTGAFAGSLAIFTNITERKQAETALQRTKAELERSNADLQHFAYVVSHDLQEPLRMVSSYVKLLEQRYAGRLDTDADEFIGYAVDGAQRMSAMIQGVLDYSRINSRGRDLSPTDCEALFNHVLVAYQLAIEDSAALVTHDPLPVVLGDETQLGQVFQNLLGNALKFRGTEPARVHVSAQQENGEWIFSLQDNGIGIDPRYADKLFQIFQRLHTRDVYPGTGIGLALCRRIVERHGGRIWFVSQPGQGSTFYFTLPIQAGTAGQR